MLLESSHKHWRTATIILLIVVHAIMLYNAIFHDARIAYDAHHHLENIRIYSQLRLPKPEESAQFFGAPLPYAVPSAAYALGFQLTPSAHVAMLFQVLLSLGSFVLLGRLCRWTESDNWRLTFFASLFLAIVPAYYRSFTFIRGEPYVMFFALSSTVQLFELLRNPKAGRATWLGINIALLVLSRQWGVPVATALGLFGVLRWQESFRELRILQYGILAGLVALCGSAWFYLGLTSAHDTPKAFNREAANSFRFSNQPAKFYFGTGSGKLFSQPFRPSFRNQLWPILFADTWGDYWGYFLIYARDSRKGDRPVVARYLALDHGLSGWMESNRRTLVRYMAQVNRVMLVPSLLTVFLVGGAVVLALKRTIQSFRLKRQPEELSDIRTVAGMICGLSFLVYLWFLIQYPEHTKGDPIKATYIVYLFPFAALLLAERALYYLGNSRGAMRGVLALGVILFALTAPLMVSRYTWEFRNPSAIPASQG